MISTAVQALKEAKKSEHTVWFYGGSFTFWKGYTATTIGRDWDRCDIQGHGHSPIVTIRDTDKTNALSTLLDHARLLDVAFKAGRQYQAEEIRKAIHFTGGA